MIGGLIPYVRAGFDRHAIEWTAWLEITWLRARVRLEIGR